MAGLVQRTRCCSPVIVTFPATASLTRRDVRVRMVAPKPVRLAICCASSESGSVGEDVSQERMVRVLYNTFLCCRFECFVELLLGSR